MRIRLLAIIVLLFAGAFEWSGKLNAIVRRLGDPDARRRIEAIQDLAEFADSPRRRPLDTGGDAAGLPEFAPGTLRCRGNRRGCQPLYSD